MKLLKLLLKSLLLVSIAALCARTGNAQAQCGLPGIIFIQYHNNRATCPASSNATYVILPESNVRQATFQCTADTNVQPPPNPGTVYDSYSEQVAWYAYGALYCNYNSVYTTYECPPKSDVSWTEATSPSDYNRFYNREYSFVASGGACPQSNFVQDFWECNGLACSSGGGGGTRSGPVYCNPCDGIQDPSTCCSPILIDTTGRGFSLTDASNGVLFDIGANGIPIQMAWTAAGSGNAFLVLPEADGLVHNGRDLFGSGSPQPPSAHPNGFAALAVYDLPTNGGNGDGIIDSRDAIFSSLRLWIDANHDGISQPEEIHTLPSLGVNSISLTYQLTERTDQYGNYFRYRAVVNPGDPANVGRAAYDVFFRVLTTTGSVRKCPVPPREGMPTGRL